MAKNKKRRRKAEKQKADVRNMLESLSSEVLRLRASLDKISIVTNPVLVYEGEDAHRHAYSVADSLKH